MLTVSLVTTFRREGAMWGLARQLLTRPARAGLLFDNAAGGGVTWSPHRTPSPRLHPRDPLGRLGLPPWGRRVLICFTTTRVLRVPTGSDSWSVLGVRTRPHVVVWVVTMVVFLFWVSRCPWTRDPGSWHPVLSSAPGGCSTILPLDKSSLGRLKSGILQNMIPQGRSFCSRRRLSPSQSVTRLRRRPRRRPARFT